MAGLFPISWEVRKLYAPARTSWSRWRLLRHGIRLGGQVLKGRSGWDPPKNATLPPTHFTFLLIVV